jgi:hypothetical protein
MDYKKKESEIKEIYNHLNYNDNLYHVRDILNEKNQIKAKKLKNEIEEEMNLNKNLSKSTNKNSKLNKSVSGKKKIFNNDNYKEEIEDSDYPFFKEKKKRVVLLSGKNRKEEKFKQDINTTSTNSNICSQKFVYLNLKIDDHHHKNFETITNLEINNNNKFKEINNYLRSKRKIDNKFLINYNKKIESNAKNIIKKNNNISKIKNSPKRKKICLFKNEELKTKMNLDI